MPDLRLLLLLALLLLPGCQELTPAYRGCLDRCSRDRADIEACRAECRRLR